MVVGSAAFSRGVSEVTAAGHKVLSPRRAGVKFLHGTRRMLPIDMMGRQHVHWAGVVPSRERAHQRAQGSASRQMISAGASNSPHPPLAVHGRTKVDRQVNAGSSSRAIGDRVANWLGGG